MMTFPRRWLPRVASTLAAAGLFAIGSSCGAQAARTATATGPASAQPASSQLAVAELRVGIERLAKLHFEQKASQEPERARRLLQRERERVQAALRVLQADAALTPTQRSRVGSLADGLGEFAGPGLDAGAAADVYRDSEALVARLTFISTALAARDDASLGALLDLVTRAAATAQRLGKINFAHAGGLRSRTLEVDTTQALIEFRSALESIGTQRLDEATRNELTLAQHQWIMLRPSLAEDGFVRDAQRLRHLATTTDRIADSLLALARRAARGGAPAAP
jgi:hypothetical protein